MEKWLFPITLTGNLVELIPLETAHADSLLAAASDGKLWELWFTSVPDENNIAGYVHTALAEYTRDQSLPFAVVHRATGNIIGTTRYMNATPAHKRLEIGCTWYAQSFQRTGVNTECKYLLLQHAFETLGCIAVEFRTHWHNSASRNAIARLGAKQDGILRNHQIDKHGIVRDTVVFSILQSEWAAVKQSLGFRLKRRRE